MGENLGSFLLGVWCFCAAIAVPLYAPEGYVEIGMHKWGVFIYSSLILLPVVLVFVFIKIFAQAKEKRANSGTLPILLIAFAASCTC